jgi:hypothetical protein
VRVAFGRSPLELGSKVVLMVSPPSRVISIGQVVGRRKCDVPSS